MYPAVIVETEGMWNSLELAVGSKNDTRNLVAVVGCLRSKKWG